MTDKEGLFFRCQLCGGTLGPFKKQIAHGAVADFLKLE